MFERAPSNLNSTTTTKTTGFFNNYFQLPLEISPGINDSILSYFQQQTGDLESAKLLVQTIIETAQANREDPLVLLEKFQKLPLKDLNAVLAVYLNASRVNTSFLGVRQSTRTNPYVERSIVA